METLREDLSEDIQQSEVRIEKRLDSLETKLDQLRAEIIPALKTNIAVEAAKSKWLTGLLGGGAGLAGTILVMVVRSFIGL